MEDNACGKLISVDLPVSMHKINIVNGQSIQTGFASGGRTIGSAIPQSLRSRWELRLGNSLEVLPDVISGLPTLSMFIHDSLHTRDHMLAEYRLGYERLQAGGLLVSDDISYNAAWKEFCTLKQERGVELTKGIKGNKFGFLVKSNTQ